MSANYIWTVKFERAHYDVVATDIYSAIAIALREVLRWYPDTECADILSAERRGVVYP